MYIQNLRIDRYGYVANLALDGLTQGITVVHGGPATGKSTLLKFARAILYGFDAPANVHDHAAHLSEEFGGAMTWARGHHQYTIRRHDGGTFDGRLKVTDNGQEGSRAMLTEMLRGASAELYARLFTVDFSRRPDVSALLEEAARCGFHVQAKAIDAVKLQELKQRLATMRATYAAFAAIDQTTELLQARRRELLDEIAKLELDAARHHHERSQIQSQIEATQLQLETSRHELYAVRKALDEVATTRQECRARLSKAEAAAAHSRTHEAEIRELEARIERWNEVLREAAQRYELLAKHAAVAPVQPPRHDEFEANLVALDTYLSELELTATSNDSSTRTWSQSEYAEKMRGLRERLIRLRSHLGWQKPATVTSVHCECERKQLTRTQAELQASLRYLEQERDALLADSRPSPELTDEINRLRKQLESFDAKENELKRRFEAVTLASRQQESDLATLQQRLDGFAADAAERLLRFRDELQQVERLLSEVERRQALRESIADTERQIKVVEEGGGDSSILRAATNYLRRISADAFQRIEVTPGHHVWAADAEGHRLSWGHLSEGARDKVYLSLCLALVEAHDRRHAPLPLMWKDVFTNFDSRQVPATAELLRHFIDDGRQLLLLTRHDHVESVFRMMNVPGRKLVATHARPGTVAGRSVQGTGWDVNDLLSVAGEADTNDDDLEWEINAEAEIDGHYFLYEDNPIEQSPSLSSDNVVRLRRLGITTVGDLLEAAADDIASHLSYVGITSKMVTNWQSQALLMCHVARLREYDARILVACGITNPDQLRRIPPTEVRSMIERFAESSEGRAMLLSGTEFELSRVTDWVRTDEMDSKDRRRGVREQSSSRPSATTRGAGSKRSHGEHAADRLARRAVRRAQQRSHGRKQGGDASNRLTRQNNREKAPRDREHADVVQMKTTTDADGLNFYLESDAGVVDAPSIGPRTAERLEKVGVVTVSDLLAADPDDVARRLKNKRMSAKMLREWQQQTELACRVPQLRGHDAQILVAIGITEVEDLAASDPQELWSQVEPFIDSAAGKRIIRSSKAPDFEEVFHWIEWAKQARALKVA